MRTKPRLDRFILEIRRMPVRVVTAVPVELKGEPGLTVTLAKGDPPARLPKLDELAKLYLAPNALNRSNVMRRCHEWAQVLRANGLPDFLPGPDNVDTRPAEIMGLDPDRLPTFISFYELHPYAGMARGINASQVVEDRRDYGPLRELLPGRTGEGELETVRLQMTAGDLLRTLRAFRPFVDGRTGKWFFVAGGWWPLLAFRTLVRAPRYTDILKCAAPDCDEPVPPERRLAGRYARGKRGKHYHSDQCMWRDQKRHQRPKRDHTKAVK